jgi:hypothetical protein
MRGIHRFAPALRRLAGPIALCGFVELGVACGGAKKPPESAAKPSSAYRGEITDLVPAAGLRWMVVVRPRELLTNDNLRTGVNRLFPSERLDVFAKNSGIDLRTLDVGCVAGFDIGTLYLAKVSGATPPTERAFLARLASDPVTKHPGPGVVHITGLIGLTPESFVGIDGNVVGVSVKDPTLTKVAAGFALGKLKKSPSALRGAALKSLPSTLAEAPLRFYAPGPFGDEWSKGAHGLLADTVAVGISARLTSPDTVDALAVLEGDFGNDAPATIQRAIVTFQDLAQSGLGRLLSLHDESVVPEIVANDREITLRVRLPLRRMLDGLYAAVAADVRDLLDYKAR